MPAPAIGVRPGWAPGSTAQIDWSHPLAQGLVFCALRGVDLVTGFRATVSAHRATHYGVGVRSTGANADTTVLDFNNERFSVMAAGAFTANTTGTTVFGRSSYTSESVNSGWSFSRSASILRFVTYGNVNQQAYLLNGGTLATGPFVMVGAFNLTTSKELWTNVGYGFVSGASLTVATTTAGLEMTSSTDGHTAIAAAWRNRVLTATEAAMLRADPFCFLRY